MENGTKYITILRNPVTQFESLFYYEHFNEFLGLKNRINAFKIFLASPMHYFQRLLNRRNNRPEALPLLRNSMLFDLGYDVNQPRGRRSDRRVDLYQILRQIEKDFHLVLITEYFDESLVLLKRKFCWSFEDILYLKQNVRANTRNDQTELRAMTDTQAERTIAWNNADYKIYRHFNDTLWRKIAEYGESFYKDLAEFKNQNAQVKTKCRAVPSTFRTDASDETGVISERLRTSTVKQYKMGVGVKSYHKSFCEKMLLSEVEYLERFRRKLEKS